MRDTKGEYWPRGRVFGKELMRLVGKDSGAGGGGVVMMCRKTNGGLGRREGEKQRW